MARRAKRDMSMEEFDEWSAARAEVAAHLEIAAEEGGPRVSLIPVPATVPQDFLPDEVELSATPPSGPRAVPFDPEPSRKLGGWSAERQRLFIEALAETGTVHTAARSSGISARSAYRLRTRSPAFARAWDTALQLAVGRLSALVFDRAIHGRVEQVYDQGTLVAERRVPSDKLLTWLLARLDPKRFALPWEQRGDADPQAEAVAAFPSLLAGLSDTANED